MDTTNFMLVGVGGQGTLLASDVLAAVGLCAGYEVKKSEVHGMAQRGGSVSSHVRWGKSVPSPLIGKGEVDILVAFERVEAVRYVDLLRPGGKILVNDHAIVPMTVTAGDATYPSDDEIVAALKQATPDVVLIDGIAIAEALGNARVNNVVLLGALSRWLDVEAAVWEEVIAGRVPPRYKELNMEAFKRGRAG